MQRPSNELHESGRCALNMFASTLAGGLQSCFGSSASKAHLGDRDDKSTRCDRLSV